MDSKLAKRLDLYSEQIATLRVMVANGVRLSTMGICKNVQWDAQGSSFTTDFYLLPLKGCNIVLGIQWLLSLGSIIWNFSSLTMQFEHRGKNHILQGVVPGSLQLVSSS